MVKFEMIMLWFYHICTIMLVAYRIPFDKQGWRAQKKFINSALVKGGASGNKLAHFVSHALRQPADPLLKNPKDLAHPARSRGISALDPAVLEHCKPRYTSPWVPSSRHLSSLSPSKDSTPLVAQWGLDHTRGESCRPPWLNQAERSPGCWQNSNPRMIER